MKSFCQALTPLFKGLLKLIKFLFYCLTGFTLQLRDAHHKRYSKQADYILYIKLHIQIFKRNHSYIKSQARDVIDTVLNSTKHKHTFTGIQLNNQRSSNLISKLSISLLRISGVRIWEFWLLPLNDQLYFIKSSY